MACGDLLADQRRDVGGRDRSQQGARLVFNSRPVRRNRCAGRRRFRQSIDTFIVQQTYDFNFTDTYLLPPSQYRAPRFDVLGYIGYAGTSMATPHVAGAAAILMQQGITSPAAIEDALKRTAVDLGTPGRDNFFGYGLINVRNAMFGIGAAK